MRVAVGGDHEQGRRDRQRRVERRVLGSSTVRRGGALVQVQRIAGREDTTCCRRAVTCTSVLALPFVSMIRSPGSMSSGPPFVMFDGRC